VLWDDRKALATELPEMLRRLTRGLDILSFTGTLREEILQWLELEHVRAMRGDPIPEAELAAAAPLDLDQLAQEEAERQAWVDRLRIGNWYEILNEEGVYERYTLAWVSPQRSRLFFANRKGLQGRILLAREFAHRLQHGGARLLAAGPLIEQALQHLFTILAKGDDFSLQDLKHLVPAEVHAVEQRALALVDDDPWMGAE
jgi:hypothetical protein